VNALSGDRPLTAAPTAPRPPARRGEPGLGLGWQRVAEAVAQTVPVAEIERIWLFPPVRHEDREWGTAVIARRVQAGRLRVHTGQYYLVVRGRERGQGQVSVDDVGETPDDVLPEVIRGVQQRANEDEPPVEIAPALWYENDDELPPAG
jgi:hypothetical protein